MSLHSGAPRRPPSSCSVYGSEIRSAKDWPIITLTAPPGWGEAGAGASTVFLDTFHIGNRSIDVSRDNRRRHAVAMRGAQRRQEDSSSRTIECSQTGECELRQLTTRSETTPSERSVTAGSLCIVVGAYGDGVWY